MATRSATKVAAEKAATTKAKSDANPRPSRRKAPAVEVRHVEPVRPDREQFPSGVEGTRQFRAAEEAYESALLAFAAESGAPDFGGDLAAIEQFFTKGVPGSGRPGVAVVPVPVGSVVPKLDEVVAAASGVEPKKRRRPPVVREDHATVTGQVEERRPSTKKAPARSSSVPVPEGFKSWTDPKLATAVVRMKTKGGKTIKEIAAALGLPAVHRSWFLVSKVWRDTADAKGLDRPRLSAEAIEARKAKRDA
jgi:hypothetical protein